MKSNAKLKIIIFFTLGILFVLAPKITINPNLITGNNNVINLDNGNPKISKLSGKIHIINNSGWVDFRNAGNCTGSGIYSDPYVIEDLEIDGRDSGNCILIENSNVYFKIENCTVYNAGWGSDAGIRLLNVNNSQLIGNDCSSSYLGIDLSNGSYNNTITGNIVNNNGGGIHLFISDNNTISGNTVNNNLWSGVYLLGSNYTIISENTMNGNDMHGIQLLGSNNNIISGNTMNDNNMIGIRLESSNTNTISGNTANNNIYGIWLFISSYNTISGNNLIGNDECIFESISCQGNVIQNNYCTHITPSLNYLPFILIICISILGVSVFIIYQNRKRFRKPQDDLEFL
jgi:parallel beta-helix repeat protein